MLELDIIEEFLLCACVCLESALKHCSLSQGTMGHYASVLATSMSRLNVHSQISSASCLLDFPHDVVGQLFLERSSSCAPLSDSCVFAEPDQFLGGNEANIGHTGHRLVMMAAHAADLAAHDQHTLIPILTIIRKGGSVRSLLISSHHDLIKVHLSKSVGSFLAVGVCFPINQERVQHLFESHSCFLNELLHVLLRDVFRDVVSSPEPFTLSFHPFFDCLRKRFFH